MRTARSILLWVLAITLPAVSADLVHAQRATRWIAYDQAFALPGRAPGADRIVGELPTVPRWLDDERYLELRAEGEGNQKLYAVNAADGHAELYRDVTALTKDLPKGADPARPAATSADGTE